MGLKDATTFKAAIDAAAVQLTAAWADDTIAGEVAVDIKNPNHPLRLINKLFTFNPKTGTILSNNDYIDAAYAGNFPNVGNEFDVVTDIGMVFGEAAVEAATPSQIDVTLVPRATQTGNYNQYSFGAGTTYLGAIVGSRLLDGILILELDTPVAAGDVITLTYVAGGEPTYTSEGSALDDFSDAAVTNNVV